MAWCSLCRQRHSGPCPAGSSDHSVWQLQVELPAVLPRCVTIPSPVDKGRVSGGQGADIGQVDRGRTAGGHDSNRRNINDLAAVGQGRTSGGQAPGGHQADKLGLRHL